MDKNIRIEYNIIGYNVTDREYFLRAFGKTALNFVLFLKGSK